MNGGTASATVRMERAAGSAWRAVDRGPQKRIWRALSVTLLVLACILTPVAVTAKWASTMLSDQDAYLAAVEPLATDPAIVSALENRVSSAIDEQITNLQLADKIGDELQSLGLPPKLATLATGYLATFRTDITDAIHNMVNELVTSPKFAELWDKANAKAHETFVTAMQGGYDQNLDKLHSINLDLTQGVAAVKSKLASAGVSWANQIPDIPVVFNLTGQADLAQIAQYYNLVNTLGTWLPWVVGLLLLLSILIAPSRLTGLARAGFWVLISLLVLVIGLAVGKSWLVSQSPLQPQVTQAFTQQLLVGMRDEIRALALVAAVAAVAAWLFGRSRSARALRRQTRETAGLVRDARWYLWVRLASGVIAAGLVIWLLSMDDPRLLTAVLLVLIAGIFVVIAASPGAGGPEDDLPDDDGSLDGPAGGAAAGQPTTPLLVGAVPPGSAGSASAVDDRPTDTSVTPVTPASESPEKPS
ncbi:hypothetical protein [Nakamurella sp.]|uniref:hypothetical protein n=1 Tax=Nakamurella sp. TaxID=1869182 RepID=UPI003B3A62D1